MTGTEAMTGQMSLRAQRQGGRDHGRLAVLVAVLVLAAGCGGDDDSSKEADSDVTSAVAPCSEVWVLGERLPGDYVTCDDGVEGYNPNNGYWHCADGTEIWQDGESSYFASKDAVIRADEDGALHARLEACGALDSTS